MFYIMKERFLLILDRHTIHVPITWPAGTYGLMRAASGCPADNTHWAEGWRKQDTEDVNSKNEFSPNIQNYLSGNCNFHLIAFQSLL